MTVIYKINDKEIFDIDTTILHTSKYNYNDDMKKLIEENAEVITTNTHINIDDLPLKLLNEMGVIELINKERLTKIDVYTINILSSVTSQKDVIVFYDILSYVNNDIKEKVIKKLKEQGKRIINYTSEIEETLLLDYIILVHENKVIMEGKTKEFLKEEKIIKKLGFSLPTIVELSSGLKYYNLLKEIFINKESLVDYLWK